jgi:hypothetical protein
VDGERVYQVTLGEKCKVQQPSRLQASPLLDGSPVNESGKIENGKTRVSGGPRARTGWGVEEGPEEGWGDGGYGVGLGDHACNPDGRYADEGMR